MIEGREIDGNHDSQILKIPDIGIEYTGMDTTERNPNVSYDYPSKRNYNSTKVHDQTFYLPKAYKTDSANSSQARSRTVSRGRATRENFYFPPIQEKHPIQRKMNAYDYQIELKNRYSLRDSSNHSSPQRNLLNSSLAQSDITGKLFTPVLQPKPPNSLRNENNIVRFSIYFQSQIMN